MNRLAELQYLLNDTSAAIAQSERWLAEQPASFSARFSLESIAERQRELEEEFLAEAKRLGVDVCSYRFFADHVRPTVNSLCGTLTRFQELFSLVYKSVRFGPTDRGHAAEIADESSLFFGYSFSGSVGVVLTVPERVRDAFGTNLEASIERVRDMSQVETPGDIVALSHIVGSQAIRAFNKWISQHIAFDINGEVTWWRGNQALHSVRLDVPRLRTISQVLRDAKETVVDDYFQFIRVSRADIEKETFTGTTDDGLEIKGRLGPEIVALGEFAVGPRYRCKLSKKTKVHFVEDQPEVPTFTLLNAVRSTEVQDPRVEPRPLRQLELGPDQGDAL